MNPSVKKFFSALFVVVLGAVLAFVQQYAVHLGPAAVAVVASVLAGVAHYVPALGTKDATITAAVEDGTVVQAPPGQAGGA